MKTAADPRIAELLQLARAEGLTLPYSPELIIDIEDRGHYIDLRTGFIGDSRDCFSLTVIGEAELIVLNCEVSE